MEISTTKKVNAFNGIYGNHIEYGLYVVMR